MRRITWTVALLAAVALAGWGIRPTVAQDAAAPPAAPTASIDRIMGLIGDNRFDDAVGLMDGLKAQPDQREAARSGLLRLRDDQGQYHGYDIAAVQKFTGRFERVDVLGYYDQQPVLFQFEFYRAGAADTAGWAVLTFRVNTSVREAVEILKETPVDYYGGRHVQR